MHVIPEFIVHKEIRSFLKPAIRIFSQDWLFLWKITPINTEQVDISLRKSPSSSAPRRARVSRRNKGMLETRYAQEETASRRTKFFLTTLSSRTFTRTGRLLGQRA